MRAFQKSCSSIAAVVVLFGMFFPVLARAEPGITSNKIIIGQSAAFTGSPSEISDKSASMTASVPSKATQASSEDPADRTRFPVTSTQEPSRASARRCGP